MILLDENIKDKLCDNRKFRELKGYINEKLAQYTLAEFFYNNLGITVHILTGGQIRLFPYQEMVLRGWFDHNFNMFIATRGGSKTTLASIFAWLYPIFNKGTKTVLASSVFRSSRRIINEVERIANHKNAKLLRSCFETQGGKIRIHRPNDEWYYNFNEGSVIALPLNEKIRGQRAEILICDEGRLIPKVTYETVLVPFLTAKSKITDQLRIKEIEDALVTSGSLSEEDRTIIESDKKIIMLSSASFQFEFLYQLYSQWVDKIVNPSTNPHIRKKYFVVRLGWKALPKELIEKDIIEEAKSGGEQTSAFRLEFGAEFVSSSDGYFSAQKLEESTVKDGDVPCCQIRGGKDSKYILAIDPSFSSSKASDAFAMTVHLINSDNKTITQVHTYAVSGGDLKDHTNYLYYLLTNFNIVFIIADLPGENNSFIQSANESVLFASNQIKLSFIEGEYEVDDYLPEIMKGKNTYNLLNRRICYRQKFNSDWIRKANEYMQGQVDNKKIQFASKICGNSQAIDKAMELGMPVDFKDVNGKKMEVMDFIGLQDELIIRTKSEISLIEVRSTVLGTLQWDLPQALRRSSNPLRARKDTYSCTLMGCWGSKIYWDIIFSEGKKTNETFAPIIIK